MVAKQFPFNGSKLMPLYAIIFSLFSLLISGCTSGQKAGANLRLIYNEAAQYHKPDRNPVIVIPGILGSKLIDNDTGRSVWGAFDPESANPKNPQGARLISLPIVDNKKLSELTDNVRPNGVLDKVHIQLLGIPIDIRAYAGILSTLGVGGYRDEELGLNAIDYGDNHFTCFQFDYDWRRDNVENAKRLKTYIEDKRAYIQAEYKKRFGIENAEVKFDVVAHSMGGLMLRYFLRYGDADLSDSGDMEITWDGAQYVDRAVLVATPNAGSVQAMQQLVQGYDVAKPILPHYPAALLSTFPSIFQLLPRPRHGAYVYDNDLTKQIENIYDAELWESNNWGLASISDDNIAFLDAILPEEKDPARRREIALSVQKKILARAKAFHHSIDRKSTPPAGTEFFLVAGDAKPTAQLISIDSKSGELSIANYGPGDGTVLRSSALFDERQDKGWQPQLISPIDWSSVLFLSSDHLGLTEDPAFTDNVLYWLLEDPRL